MKKGVLIVSLLLGGSVLAQGNDPVVVDAQGDRKVENAYRIAVTPVIVDTLIPSAIVNYPLLLLRHETSTEVEKINAASIKTVDKLSKLYHSYIKLGVGTELMPLGEIYVDGTRDRRFIYGAHVKHLSSFGNISDYAPAQFDRTKVNVFGGINEKRYELRGNVHYNNQGLHYYGVSDTLGLDKDSIAQRYSDFGLSGMFTSHVKDSANVNYRVGLTYNNYLSKKPRNEDWKDWRARENYFAVESGAWYKYGKETYALDLNIRYNGYKYGIADTSLTGLDTGIVLNNTVINLHPHIITHLQNHRFKAKVGLDLAIDIHSKTKAYVYPVAEVKYSMFNDIFIPYVGIRGGLKQTTFKGLTNENEFLLPNVTLKNEKTPIDFYGGIKGTLSKRISFNAGISFANVRDKALFVSDTLHSSGNQFDVIYDTLNVTTIEGAISYQLKEKIKVDVVGRYFSYSALNNSYAWNLPQFQFILRGSYNLYEKFFFNLDLNMEEGRRALLYQQVEGSTEENGQHIQKLGFIADVNLGVEYRYNQRISAFVQFNNLASQGYNRWYNYPVQRFQFLGGITFRF